MKKNALLIVAALVLLWWLLTKKSGPELQPASELKATPGQLANGTANTIAIGTVPQA